MASTVSNLNWVKRDYACLSGPSRSGTLLEKRERVHGEYDAECVNKEEGSTEWYNSKESV